MKVNQRLDGLRRPRKDVRRALKVEMKREWWGKDDGKEWVRWACDEGLLKYEGKEHEWQIR